MDYELMEADFLILGGGSAGCMAAIKALELNPSAKVVIFEKSDLKYGGSIARGMDALNIVAIPGFTSPELYVDAITQGTAGICDAGPSHTMAARSFDLLQKLTQWGVYFPRDSKGNYKTLKYHVKGQFQTCMEEPDLKVMIAQKSLALGAKVYNRTMAIKLLKDGERIAGAVGLNVRSGNILVCRAKAVLMANGGASRFSMPNSGYPYGVFDFPGNTGEGFVLALQAGASLGEMEYGSSAMLIKDANMPLLAITVTRGGQVKDIFDNILMENEVGDMKLMDEAYARGEGPLRIKLSHLPEAVVAEIEHILFSTERPVQERFFAGRNVDFRKRDIELWPTESQICGGHGLSGIRINERAESAVPGLYAAGDVASVPKQHLSGAFVFGEVAAEQAVEYMAANDLPRLDLEAIEQTFTENQRRKKLVGPLKVGDIEFKARRFISDYLISPKNAYKFDRWAEWSPKLRSDLLQTSAITSGHELARSYELESILACADISALAGSTRTESRWGRCHYRADYPSMSPDWNCHVLIRQDASGKLNAHKAPIQTSLTEEVVL